MRIPIVLTLVCGLLPAQQPKPTEGYVPKFIAPVTNILAPTKVFDHNGNLVTGIRSEQFHLFDNGKEQNIHVDESLIPISMAIAIQCNHEVDQILPKVNRIGNLIGPLMLGEKGEAAVIAFDARIRTLQDFTSDPDKITEAVKRIHSGSLSSRLVDGVDAAEHMLRSRPKNRQKIILLISETRDEGSENDRGEILDYVQANNVVVYTITMSRILGKLTAPPVDPPPDIWQPAMHPMPSIVPATPNTVEQAYGTGGTSAQFVPLFTEIFKDIKNIFRIPVADLFTQGTGGSKFDFYKGRGLEDAIQQMAAELHLQYMLTYSPNDKEEGGWHDIRVDVAGLEKAKVKTRPGYWMAADFR